MMRRQNIFALGGIALLSFALYALAIFKIDYESTLKALGQVNFFGWFLILSLSFGNYFLRYLRWSYAIKVMSCKVPFGIHFSIYLTGFAFTVTPGKVGEWLRAVFLRPLGVEYSVSTWVFMYEHILDLFVITVFASLILASFPAYTPWIALVITAIIVSLAFLRASRVRCSAIKLADKAKWRKIAMVLKKINFQLDQAQPIFTLKNLAFGVGLGILAWGFEVIGLLFVLEAMEFSQPLVTVAGIYGAATLLGALSFIPGGVGTTETVMIVGLTALGCELSVALAATLICRVSTLWFAVLLGGVSLGALGILGYRVKNLG